MKILGNELGETKQKLGIEYHKSSTIFRVWAPTRKSVELMLYDEYNHVRRTVYRMYKEKDGVFSCEISGDLEGKFYVYRLDGTLEVTDPYAVASSINSKKSFVLDIRKTDPRGFREHTKPQNDRRNAILYEVHIKDFTVDMTSGVKHRGRYLGFVEKGRKYKGYSTAIDHLVELGITHVHLLPVADYISVLEEPELFLKSDNYNWGYDPELYNVPEGSYSLNPYDPKERIYELKTLIMRLHEAGISVVLDVVYNHTYRTFDSNFNALVPNYYYRRFENGTFSNGSGTGNELATEKSMTRKFIIESLLYWLDEYKIDGFRFDLMALIDSDTIYKAIRELRKRDPNIMIYGEPWVAQTTPLPEDKRCTFGAQNGRGFGFFNPYFRDALKGDGNSDQRGFVQGEKKHKNAVETGMIGSINFDGHHAGFCRNPDETINYFNSHDDLIVSDKLKLWFGDIPEIPLMNRLLISMIMTSQGIPFIHAGNEFVRDKKLVKNSYKSDLTINGIDWSLKEKHYDVFKYTCDIIRIRKEYAHFRYMNRLEIKRCIRILSNLPDYMVGSMILSNAEVLLVIHNTGWSDAKVDLSELIIELEKKYDVKQKGKIRLIFGGKGAQNLTVTPTKPLVIDKIATTILSVKVEG